MRVLFDTNILLDVILARVPFVTDAAMIWQANDARQIAGHITATSITDVYYIVRKQAGIEKARDAVRICLKAFDICEVNRHTLEVAEALAEHDFEDDLQQACALLYALDAIVTRDEEGFKASRVPAVTPSEMLAQLGISS
jgi:predicted nucleic acid-binding protein